MKIKGYVDENRSPCIYFRSSQSEKYSLVVDTGFNGSLCLPKKLIKELNFQKIGTYEVELADGSIVPSPVYSGEIIWFRQKTEVIAHETVSHEGLIGTELLRGTYFELDIDANYVMITKKE